MAVVSERGEEDLTTPPEYFYLPPLGQQSLIAGIQVRPHVQAFADAVRKATRVQSIGTYIGHDPSADLALDLFHAIGDDELADAICWFAVKALNRGEGIDYIISRQRIFNPEISNAWRVMADRGSPTQNHMDHVHISFEPTPTKPPKPDPPKPEPQEEEYTMFIGDAPPERGGGVWQSDGVLRKPVRTGDTWAQLGDDGAKVAKHIGVFKVGTFDDLIDIESVLADLKAGSSAGGVDLSAIADRVAARVADLIADRLAS